MGSPPSTGTTVADIGEMALVDAVVQRLAQAGRRAGSTVLGPGDDAAVVAAEDGRVVATTDVLVQGRHFRLDWSEPVDIGTRAAAANLADVVAMGAVPTALLVGLAMPVETEVEWVLGLADGLAEEARAAGAAVVGGDVVRGDAVVVSVTALGSLEGRDPVTRSGARPGDLVAVAGRLGWAAAGFAVLSRGFRSPRVLVEAHRRPAVPYAEGPRAAALGATAMVDVSDGLLADLGHVARRSGIGISVSSDAFPVPPELADTARALNADPVHWLLAGGEDHALAATFPPDVDLPMAWTVVGRVEEGEGVLVDGAEWTGPRGWTSF